MTIYFEDALCLSSKQCLTPFLWTAHANIPCSWMHQRILRTLFLESKTAKYFLGGQFDYHHLKMHNFKIILCFSAGYLDLNHLQTDMDIVVIMHWDYTNLSIHQSIIWALCPWLNGQQMNACANIYVFPSTFKFQLWNGEDLGYSTDRQPDFFCTNRRGWAPPFCICIHFVVVYVKLVEASNIKKSLAFCSCTSWIVEASNLKSHLHIVAVQVELLKHPT